MPAVGVYHDDMALGQDDVDAIARLLDERLAAHGKHIEDRLAQQEAAARRRRRFWLWMFLLLTLGSLAASILAANRAITWAQDQLAAQEQGFIDAKIAYQRQLAQSSTLQAERAEAERRVNYKPQQPQDEYEAELIASALRLFNQSMASQARMKAAGDSDDPEALLREMEGMTEMLSQATEVLPRILLRNTDPARNTAKEQALVGEARSASAAPVRPSEADEALQRLEREAAR